MRTERTVRLVLAASLAIGMVAGCHSASSNGGGSQGGSGDSKSSGGNGQSGGNNAQKGGNAQGQGGNPAGELTEPATSTNGASSGPVAAASDSGSPAAVAHQSVAMPGAPEPTDPKAAGEAKQQPAQAPATSASQTPQR